MSKNQKIFFYFLKFNSNPVFFDLMQRNQQALTLRLPR